VFLVLKSKEPVVVPRQGIFSKPKQLQFSTKMNNAGMAVKNIECIKQYGSGWPSCWV